MASRVTYDLRLLLTGAYRLFFPAAAGFAALALPLWLVAQSGGQVPLPDDPYRWHMHEMLFGYLGAALAGFLLTAIPNWTGRPALTGVPLLALFGLWLVARGAMLGLASGPQQSALAMLFPTALALFATREIALGDNRRNLVVAAMVWLLAAAQAMFLVGFEGPGLRLGFAIAVMMMALIGGRVTPAFSRNWLKAKGRAVVVPEFGAVDRAALVLTALTLLAWVSAAERMLTGTLATLAALALLARLIRWRGWLVASEPLLAALHLAYLWLPFSLALLAGSALTDSIAFAQVVHAIGAGAIATLTLVVMMRAILGHGNRPLTGTRTDMALLAMVHIGAVLRVIAPLWDDPAVLYHLAGILWTLGFVLFVLRYGRIALAPRL